jgi:hypothetical protein
MFPSDEPTSQAPASLPISLRPSSVSPTFAGQTYSPESSAPTSSTPTLFPSIEPSKAPSYMPTSDPTYKPTRITSAPTPQDVSSVNFSSNIAETSSVFIIIILLVVGICCLLILFCLCLRQKKKKNKKWAAVRALSSAHIPPSPEEDLFKPTVASFTNPILYEALQDWNQADTTEEMNLLAGHKIAVTSQDEDGWFTGFNIDTGDVGLFPGDRAELLVADKLSKERSHKLMAPLLANLARVKDLLLGKGDKFSALDGADVTFLRKQLVLFKRATGDFVLDEAVASFKAFDSPHTTSKSSSESDPALDLPKQLPRSLRPPPTGKILNDAVSDHESAGNDQIGEIGVKQRSAAESDLDLLNHAEQRDLPASEAKHEDEINEESGLCSQSDSTSVSSSKGNQFTATERTKARELFTSMKPRLGMAIEDVDGRNQRGVKVKAIASDGPAFWAGVKLHDQVVELNGVSVKDCKTFAAVQSRLKPGTP